MISRMFATILVLAASVACSLTLATADDASPAAIAQTTEPVTLFNIGFGSGEDKFTGKPRYPSGIAFDGHQSVFINDFAELYEYTKDGKLSHRVTADRYAGRAFATVSASYVVLSQAGAVTERFNEDGRVLLSIDKREPILAVYNRVGETWAAVEVPAKWAAHYPLRFGEGQVGSLAVSETSPAEGLPKGLGDKSMPSHAAWRIRVEPGVMDQTPNLTIDITSLVDEAHVSKMQLVPAAMVVQDVRPIARDGDSSYFLIKYTYQREGRVDHYRTAMLRIDAKGRVDLALPPVEAVYPSYCVQPIAFMGNDSFVQIVLKDTKEELSFLKWGYHELAPSP